MVSGIFCLETFVFFDSNLLCNPLNNNKIQIFCCFQWNKDTKMKANHNKHLTEALAVWVVSNGTKILK